MNKCIICGKPETLDPEGWCRQCEIEYKKDSCTRRKRVYLCTVCHKNQVDAENGYDTCEECLSKQ